jgi:ribosomal protein S18 acetylase RimI-like enzyme
LLEKKQYPQAVCRTSLKQLDAVVSCYAACFPSSLAVKLGRSYVSSTLNFFYENDKRFLFHIEINNQIVGFCGCYIPEKFGDGSTSGMLQFGMKAAAQSILTKPWLLLHKEVIPLYPLVLKNLWQKITGSYKKNVATKQAPPNFVLSAGLVVIGVHPNYRGSNIFEKLMKAFDEKVLYYNLQSAKLSVKQNNDRAVHAYKKFNWQIVETLGNTYVLEKKYTGNTI